MKRIKKRKRYRLKRPAVVVSGVICAVCAVAFAGKAVSGVAEQKKQAQAAYYEAYYEEEADDRPLVCIDAGHGGSDCGADYAGAYEKDETLLIARLVKRHLESVGVKVLMTRDADTYLGLDERVEICNNASCDVLVSIHRNLYEDDPSINGVETWIHHDMPEDDVFLAEAITTRLDVIAGIKSRGVKGGSMTDSEEDYSQCGCHQRVYPTLYIQSIDCKNQNIHESIDCLDNRILAGKLCLTLSALTSKKDITKDRD